MSETLVDQLPILMDLHRYLEELTLMQLGNAPSVGISSIEQVMQITSFFKKHFLETWH